MRSYFDLLFLDQFGYLLLISHLESAKRFKGRFLIEFAGIWLRS